MPLDPKIAAAVAAVRQKADLVRKALDPLRIVAGFVPVAGPYINLGIEAADGLDDAIDALDDSLKAPAAIVPPAP